ncbi:MAG TPA: hypothetical protein VMU83_16140 [Hanamia sp.]|nr:hypothetical protein [Hanamia sp.]
MKRFSKLIIPFLLLIIFFIFLHSILQAQPGGNGCDYQDPDIPCPIDGGLLILIAVGVGYGIMKMIAAKKSGIVISLSF